MRRALMWVLLAALGVAALKHIRIGHQTLWAEAHALWQSRLMQDGVKSMADPLLDRLKPQQNKKSKKPPRRPSTEHRSLDVIWRVVTPDAFRSDGEGPEDERDLPPAPIPPPKDPLEV